MRRSEWNPERAETRDRSTSERLLRGARRWWALSLVAVALCAGSLLGGASAQGSTATAPVNDNFAQAIVLSGTNDSRTGDTVVGATLEIGEDPFITVGDVDIEATHSIWYTWTPSSDGWATISLEGSDFDTLLGVYTGGAVNALTRVASNDDGNDLWSIVTLHVAAGTTYRIRVDGFGSNVGTVDVHLSEVANPPNDDFANAIALTGDPPIARSGGNVGATLQLGAGEDQKVANVPGGASVWYTWTPSSPVRITIDTATSSFDTLLGVYTGSALGSLTVVASNDDAAYPTDKTSTVTFDANSGTTYRIRVDGFEGATGAINLHVFHANAPGEPTNVSASPGDSQATVNWTAPASNGGTPITGYELTTYQGGVSQSVTQVGTVTQWTVNALTNGTEYTFKVAAKNAIGTGPQSAPSAPVTPKANQTINVTSHAPATAKFGTSFSVSAGGGASGNPVTFSSGGACSNSGNTFTMTSGTGTCSVNYDQAGNATYNAAPQVVESVSAQKADQTITVTTHSPTTAVSASSFTVAATAPGGAVSFSSSGSCSNSGATFTITLSSGTCSVRYDQAGSGNYNAAPQVLESVSVSANRFTLTVTKSGTGGGTVASSPAGISCGTTCAAGFDSGSTVTLAATSDAQSTFAGWSGACSGTGPCTVTMDAAKAAVATFNRVPQTPPPPPPPPAKCVVPNVKGKPLATAKRKIAAAHCRTGKITQAKSKAVKKGSVISQKPTPGKRLAAGSKVNLVVSRGNR